MSQLSSLLGGGDNESRAARRRAKEAKDKEDKKQKRAKQKRSQQRKKEKANEAKRKQEKKNAEAKARQQEERRVANERKAWDQDLERAISDSRGDISQFFTARGVDPEGYSSDIDAIINRTKASVPKYGNIGTQFSGLGERLYTDLTDALRGRASMDARTLDPSGRIEDSADDAIIEQILNEQRGGAEKYAQNLFDRGVITRSGLDAALQDIIRQSDVARGSLNEVGTNVLQGGRSKLGGIYDEARFKAGDLMLGENFDTAGFGGRINQAFDDFMAGLEGSFKSQVPTGLFKTTGLQNIAGAAQGPQNTPFSSSALAGLYDEDEEENKPKYDVF